MAKKVPTLTQQPEVPPSPLADFINKYRRSTGYIYRSGLLDFFDFINGKRMRGIGANAEDMVKYESLAVSYLADKTRKYPDDVIRYAKHQSETGVMPKTAHVRIVAVKEFLLRQGIELDKIAEKDVRRLQPKGGRRTDFEYIDKKTLSEILHHFDARGKAFILVLASSGVRLGEALALNWGDLKCPDRKEYPNKPASVFIRDSKTGHVRTTFITQECEQAIKEWKKTYDGYRDFATKRSLNLKNSKKEKRNGDTRIFPFQRDSAYAMWDHALQSAGYYNTDEQTKRVRMNIHRLRNFFSVQVASTAGQQFSELLLGHSDKYGQAYSGRSTEQMETDYKKAETALTIGSIAPLLERHAMELEKLKSSNEELQRKLVDMEQAQKKTAIMEEMITELYQKYQEEKQKKAGN